MNEYVAVRDLTEKFKNKRKIIIGDLHGVYDSLMELLAKVKWDPKNDVVILLGDLIDRGNKIKECLEFARNAENVYTLKGNHDQKLQLYLQGRKVNTGSLQTTIDQCGDYLDDSLKEWLESLPLIIKFGPNQFAVHAGLNPKRTIYEQKEHSVLYSRTFNAKTNSISDATAPLWWNTENIGGEQIFFGHIVSKWQAGKHVSLDGGCCFGQELRCWLSDTGEIVSVKSNFAYDDLESYKKYVNNPLLIEDDLVKEGFLNKKEKDGLVLYNYTPKTIYEKHWNDVTLRSRGVVYDNLTKEIVGPCMPKFFNLGETKESSLENLPNEPYSCYEKLDGSYVSLSYHDSCGWFTATKGSFDSPQAVDAIKILKEKYDLNQFNKKYTYIFEYISKWNSESPGARLVVSYGELRDLVLLTIFDRNK